MAYRHGNRKQISLFPASIEDYVPKDAPVRAYDVMVAALDIGELVIEYDPDVIVPKEFIVTAEQHGLHTELVGML
mgnify:CR=1 FL=1